MASIPNEIIRASAGSGKTYQLTLRFIRLLSLGADPGEIVALTFTRKAAGEFFARILTRLAGAAEKDAEAARLAREIQKPEWGAEDFRRLLRVLVDSMHRLRLGTLDGFFALILRSFPYEFGLRGDFTVPSEELAQLDRQRVLGQLFEAGDALSDAQHAFFEAFKQATWGKEENRLADLLNGFISDCHEMLLAAPDRTQWGGKDVIWPRGPEHHPLADAAMRDAIATVRGFLDGTKFTEGQIARWNGFLSAVENYKAGDGTDGPLKYFFGKFADWRQIPEADGVECKVDRKPLVFPLRVWRALIALLSHVAAGELHAACARTEAIWQILAHYEVGYHRIVRQGGRLTFADVQALLAGVTMEQRIRSKTPPLEQLELAWRLDGKFKHWLLDEFQDTSLLQWKILHPLVDEVLQDNSGSRTYFHVGDAKQAIYTWRQGEARLTDQILRKYRDAIREEPLDESHRSTPEVLEAVNAICGAQPAMKELFPAEAVGRWAALWRPHKAAKKTGAPAPKGFAALVRPPAHDKANGETAFDAELRAIAMLLKDIDPPGRGLTCAVLCRSNDDAKAAAEQLQELTGLPAIADAEQSVADDNAPCRAILHLLQSAAHPGDTLAWEAVRMTPLASVLASSGGDDAVRLEILRQIHDEGVGPCVQTWAARLRGPIPPLDAFNSARLDRLCELASQYDQEGGRDLDEFVLYARGARERAGDPARSAIRCMTIHRAKGLEFDVVFLPRLDGDSFGGANASWLSRRGENLETEWVLKGAGTDVAQCDPALCAAMEQAKNDSAYEEFCCTYVALTRAIRALYMVTAVPGESNKEGTTSKKNAAVWAEKALATGEAAQIHAGGETLDVAWQNGKADWYTRLPAKAQPPVPVPDAIPKFHAPPMQRAGRRDSRSPAASEDWRMESSQVFSPQRSRAISSGNLVHELFSRIEDPGDLRAMETWWTGNFSAPTTEERRLKTRVLECLAVPRVQELLRSPAAGTRIWREQSFEILLDGVWITGAFDRVHIWSEGARIVDFKTDAVADAETAREKATTYSPQLNLYRKVLAQLTGLPASKIAAFLLFAGPGEIVEIAE